MYNFYSVFNLILIHHLSRTILYVDEVVRLLDMQLVGWVLTYGEPFRRATLASIHQHVGFALLGPALAARVGDLHLHVSSCHEQSLALLAREPLHMRR